MSEQRCRFFKQFPQFTDLPAQPFCRCCGNVSVWTYSCDDPTAWRLIEYHSDACEYSARDGQESEFKP